MGRARGSWGKKKKKKVQGKIAVMKDCLVSGRPVGFEEQVRKQGAILRVEVRRGRRANEAVAGYVPAQVFEGD